MRTQATNLSEEHLKFLYVDQKASMAEIAEQLGCSVHKVQYWMQCHGIPRRSRSEATYVKRNPNGDPFEIKPIETIEDAYLLGMGLGLYWGEGTKASQHSVRLGNSDPKLIATFMDFLEKLFGVDRTKFRFGLQLFHDNDVEAAVKHWTESLGVSQDQFTKVVITPSRAPGTYRKKTQFGVMTLSFHNARLRDVVNNLLPTNS